MLRNLSSLISLHKSLFCITSPTIRPPNPYLGKPHHQLAHLIEQRINAKSISIDHINDLIHMGLAAQQYKDLSRTNMKLLTRCFQILQDLQNSITDQDESELRRLMLGELLGMMTEHKQVKKDEHKIERISQFYLNTYSHMLPFPQHLRIYEGSRNQQNSSLQFVRGVALNKIRTFLSHAELTLKQFIAYLKVFHYQFSAQQLNQKLQSYLSGPDRKSEITQRQKQILAYLVIHLRANYDLIIQLGIEADLDIHSHDTAKSVCLKLQIRRYQGLSCQNIQQAAQNIQKWDFDHLIWVSQFLEARSDLSNKMYGQMLKCELNPSSHADLALIFAHNIDLTPDQHQELAKWLTSQSLIEQSEKNLCKMLQIIEQHKWSQFYGTLVRKVIEISLGNFEWETQNTIYYYGLIWGIEDENMEYLRRYILNTYASLGTARKDVPTSSYFYKILQVADVNKFYANL